MATIKQIQFKRSNVAGKRPLPADIAEGELAINIKDSTLFTKNAEGQIIDLGFAKGGKIDGDVVQVGSYTQTGNFSTTGDIYSKTITTTAGGLFNGDVTAARGVIRTRAGENSNAHLWFEGEEVTGTNRNKERAVLYSSPQTDTSGQVNLRVYNGKGYAANSNNALFVFNGTGDFSAPKDVYAQRTRLSIEVVAPTLNGRRLYTRDRVFGEFGAQSYGWDDTVNYTVGDNGALALNYVYKGRAHVTGTIWHQLIDERTAPEWSLYTGSGPSNKMFSLRSVGTLGHAQVTGSLFIGAGSEGIGYVSGMGEGSLALGDNDTGFRNDGDGMFSVMANSRALIHYNAAAPKFQIEHRKATRITHTDNANTTILPGNNSSLLEIDTSLDGNNAGGNGLTLLGYNSSGKYYHYFRGTGYVAYDMEQGVNINKGGLTVGGNSSFSNTLSAANLITGGDVSFRNTSNRHLRFEYLRTDGTYAVDAYIYKDGVDNPNRRPGVRINCGTPNKASGNTSNSGDFIFGEDGTFTLPGGGTINQDGLNQNVYCMTALSTTATGSKNYLRKFRGGSGDTIWHETVQGGAWRLATGSTDVQEEVTVTNAGDMGLRRNLNMGGSLNATGDVNSSSEVLARGGSIRVRSSSNGTAHFWFQNAAGIERGVIYAENNANSIKLRANRSDGGSGNATWAFGFDGVLSWQGQANIAGSGTCVYATTQLGGSDTGIIRGNPGAGAHSEWEARSSAVQIDCPSSDVGATNIWKATKWGAYHIAAMDVYAPGGNAFVRLVLRNGGAHIWKNDSYTSPVQINAPEFYLTSDVSLKKDIRSIEDSRSNLHKVQIKRYAMKDGSNDNAIGVIAQEVQKVYPELVSENKDDGKLSVNYRGLSSVLWKIVQEQDKELEDVKSRLARIEELLSK